MGEEILEKNTNLVIYKATNLINNKAYFGKSHSFNKRRLSHIYLALKGSSNIYFHRAIRKYGKDNFKWEIIQSGCNTDKELCELEQFIILEFKELYPQLSYNLTNGGDGIPGLTHSDETKKKMSKAHKGQVPWIKGKKLTRESREKMS